MSKAYWNQMSLTTYLSSSNMAYFDSRDWLGSLRLTTDARGNVTTARTYLPFGDGVANTVGSRTNTYDGFIGLWDGGNTLTNHAPYREYENVNGRWMSPDPFQGSYDYSNPQSFNRYSYVMNNPLAFADPTGKEACSAAVGEAAVGGPIGGVIGGLSCAAELLGAGKLLESLFGLGGPSFHGSLHPRPQSGDPASLGESLGLPINGAPLNAGIASALGLPDAGCEFGACGVGPGGFTQSNLPALSAPILSQPPAWLLNFINRFSSVPGPLSEWPLNGNDWPGFTPQDGVCSTGPFASTMNSNPAILACCQAHDNCYTKYHCNASSWLPGGLPGACRSVCNATVVGCIVNAK
jgi:RHS repeat-associated protein